MTMVWIPWGDAVQIIMNGEQTTEQTLTDAADQIRAAIPRSVHKKGQSPFLGLPR